MEDNGKEERGRSVTPPANDGRTPPVNEGSPGMVVEHPDPNVALHPIYDLPGVAGPSQPGPLMAASGSQDSFGHQQIQDALEAVLAGVEDLDDDSDKSDRLPIISEDQILRTSGSFNRDDGWRAYLSELTLAIEEAEADVPDSPLFQNLPENIISDLGQAKDEIEVLRQVTRSQKRQLEQYQAVNEEMRKKMGRKDRKINQLSGDLKECLAHRAGLEQENRRMRQWLQANAPDWEDEVSSDSPPPSPQDRTGTPIRAKRRPVHQMSPSSSSGSKRSCQHSPEIRRQGSPDDVADTPGDVFRTPSTTSPQKRSLPDSGSNKRRRSTTPPPTVSVASVVSPVSLPSLVLPVDTNPPGDDDGGDDDGHSSDGRAGGSPPRTPRRPRAPRVRRVLGPRAGAFIPPAPANAQEQPRVWQRGPGRMTNLRPRVPLNLNVDQWFAHHLGRI